MYRKTRKKKQGGGEGEDKLNAKMKQNVSIKVNLLSEEDGKIKTH